MLPTLQIGPSTGNTVYLSKSMARQLLGVSAEGLNRLLETGALPDLAPSTVQELAARPHVGVISGVLPILRLGVPRLVTDLNEQAGQRWIGYSIQWNDPTVLQAARKWWATNPDTVVESEIIAATVSGFVVAVLRVFALEATVVYAHHDDWDKITTREHRHSFHAQLVGRARSLLDCQSFWIDPAADAQFARLSRILLGNRLVNPRGAPMIFATRHHFQPGLPQHHSLPTH